MMMHNVASTPPLPGAMNTFGRFASGLSMEYRQKPGFCEILNFTFNHPARPWNYPKSIFINESLFARAERRNRGKHYRMINIIK